MPQSVLGAASSASATGKMGAVVNTATGVANLYQSYQEAGRCSHDGVDCWPAAYHFAVGVADLAQAAEDMKSSNQADNTANNTSYGPGGLNGGAGYNPSSDGSSTGGASTTASGLDGSGGYGASSMKAAQAYISQMSNPSASGNPFSYDPSKGTITTADGKTYSVSALSSPSGMAGAGISQDAINAAIASEKKIDADVKKKLGNLTVATDDGTIGGGGGGSGSKGSANDPAGFGAGGRGPATASKNQGYGRDPNQLAGMQKNYNGEPIGVAGESIFNMMSRRYQLKDSQSSFLNDAELLKK